MARQAWLRLGWSTFVRWLREPNRLRAEVEAMSERFDAAVEDVEALRRGINELRTKVGLAPLGVYPRGATLITWSVVCLLVAVACATGYLMASGRNLVSIADYLAYACPAIGATFAGLGLFRGRDRVFYAIACVFVAIGLVAFGFSKYDHAANAYIWVLTAYAMSIFCGGTLVRIAVTDVRAASVDTPNYGKLAFYIALFGVAIGDFWFVANSHQALAPLQKQDRVLKCASVQWESPALSAQDRRPKLVLTCDADDEHD
jgi:hypothetical protein